jgi:hypothetical protein
MWRRRRQKLRRAIEICQSILLCKSFFAFSRAGISPASLKFKPVQFLLNLFKPEQNDPRFFDKKCLFRNNHENSHSAKRAKKWNLAHQGECKLAKNTNFEHFQAIEKIKALVCPIPKNLSTVLAAIVCLLNDEENVLKKHSSLMDYELVSRWAFLSWF